MAIKIAKGCFFVDHRGRVYGNSGSVGDKAVNAEARATLCVMKNLRIVESKIRIGREREIGTKKDVIFQ